METKYIDEINTIEKLIDRSKDTNIIYMTEDTILNTKAVQKIANRLEQLEKENKELQTIKGFEEENIEVSKFGEWVGKDYIDYKFEYENYQRILADSIPKSVIREKIDKLKREFDFYAGREHHEWQDGEFDGEVCDDLALKIGVLKELLGEEK